MQKIEALSYFFSNYVVKRWVLYFKTFINNNNVLRAEAHNLALSSRSRDLDVSGKRRRYAVGRGWDVQCVHTDRQEMSCVMHCQWLFEGF